MRRTQTRRWTATAPSITQEAVTALHTALINDVGLTALRTPALAASGGIRAVWFPYRQGFITLLQHSDKISIVADFRRMPQDVALMELKVATILGLSNITLTTDETTVELADGE